MIVKQKRSLTPLKLAGKACETVEMGAIETCWRIFCSFLFSLSAYAFF
jgi:hypothetical protein